MCKELLQNPLQNRLAGHYCMCKDFCKKLTLHRETVPGWLCDKGIVSHMAKRNVSVRNFCETISIDECLRLVHMTHSYMQGASAPCCGILG